MAGDACTVCSRPLRAADSATPPRFGWAAQAPLYDCGVDGSPASLGDPHTSDNEHTHPASLQPSLCIRRKCETRLNAFLDRTLDARCDVLWRKVRCLNELLYDL
jgi:hypothetical protein